MGLSQEGNMCAFQMKEIGRNLDGPPNGQRELRNNFGILVGRK